jgi:hypothetical protein
LFELDILVKKIVIEREEKGNINGAKEMREGMQQEFKYADESMVCRCLQAFSFDPRCRVWSERQENEDARMHRKAMVVHEVGWRTRDTRVDKG